MDILLQAAQVWNSLINTSISYTYTKKNKTKQQETTEKIKIIFDEADFHHLAGFQYLSDVQIYRTFRNKITDSIIDGKIKLEQLQKSENYFTMVEPRLIALSKLKDNFESIKLYSYNPNRYYSFRTTIKADYVLEFKDEASEYFFLFTIKNNDICNCSSIFMKDPDRNYSQGQKLLWSGEKCKFE